MDKVRKIDRLLKEQLRLIKKEHEKDNKFLRILDMSLIKRDV